MLSHTAFQEWLRREATAAVLEEAIPQLSPEHLFFIPTRAPSEAVTPRVADLLLARVSGSGEEKMAFSLASRSDLDAAVRLAVLHWVERRGVGLCPTDKDDLKRQRWIEEMRAILRGVARDTPIPPERFQGILDRLFVPEQGSLGVEILHYQVVQSLAGLEDAQLARIARHLRKNHDANLVGVLAAHPGAGPQVWQALVDSSMDRARVETALLREDRALALPSIRAGLKSGRGAGVLAWQALARTAASAEEFRPLFQRLARHDAGRALLVLREAHPALRRALRATDYDFLLAGIGAMGRHLHAEAMQYVLEARFHQAEGGEVRRRFQILAQASPQLALGALEVAKEEQLREMEAADLTPLLVASQAELRLRAIALTSRLPANGRTVERKSEEEGRRR